MDFSVESANGRFVVKCGDRRATTPMGTIVASRHKALAEGLRRISRSAGRIPRPRRPSSACMPLTWTSAPWSPGRSSRRTSLRRLHRIGQTREVKIFSFCARGSAEERILDILDRRIHLLRIGDGRGGSPPRARPRGEGVDERIFEIYERARTDAEVAATFEGLADELAAARGHYEKVKDPNEALFRRDSET